MKTPQMCSGWRCESIDFQYNLSRSDHDLELRSNFQNDLLRSTYTSFDASRQEKHDAGKLNVVPLLSQKLLQKTFFRKNDYFEFLLSGGQTCDHRSILRKP